MPDQPFFVFLLLNADTPNESNPIMTPKLLLSTLFLLVSHVFASPYEPIRNLTQCDRVPDEVVASCRKTVSENQVFFYKYAESESDCKTISDNIHFQKCLEMVHSGAKWAIATDSTKPPMTQLDPTDLNRIANSTERMALVMTIELAVATVAAVLVTGILIWKTW